MFVCGYLYLTSTGSKSSSGSSVSSGQDTKMIDVVIAVQDIPPYTTLTNEMLIVKQTADNATLTNFYTSIKDVAGSISTTEIFAGEVLNSGRVIKDNNDILGLSAKLENGKRAITINIDVEAGVAQNLKVGNYVDLIYNGAIEEKEINGQKMTAGVYFSSMFGPGKPVNTQVMDETMGLQFSVITLQKIKIVALNNSIEYRTTEPPPAYSNITFEVTPTEAAKIALMNKSGNIQLMLRPMEDDSIVSEPRGSVLNFSR
jgi:pilus assembly protein CpaB